MEPNIKLLAALVLLSAAVYKFFIYPAFLSPLSKIPAANFTARFSPLWMHYIRYTQQENETTYRLHKKHGPVVCTGPNELSVNCYDGLKTIYGGNFDKHDFYVRRFSNFGVSPMFTMKEKKPHAERKRMLSNIFSKSYIFSSQALQETTKTILLDRFLPLIEKHSSGSIPIEMLSLDYAYAKDTFNAYQFGLDLSSNLIENKQERQWFVDSFLANRPWVYWMENLPGLVAWMQKIGLGIIPEQVNRSAREAYDWHLERCDKVNAALSEKFHLSGAVEKQPIDFLRLRDALEKCEYPSAVSLPVAYPYRFDIASELFDHDVAALETEGITLTYLYYELSLRPVLQAQLRNELLTLTSPLVYPSGTVDKLPEPKDVDNLPLLDAVLQETLRRYPVAAGAQPRLTPYPSCSLAGYDNIPPNVRVQSAAYTLHRNEGVFPEPEQWRPERWLDASPADLAEMKRWFWAFGSGARMCVGSHIATYLMKYAVVALYTNYTSTIVEVSDMRQKDGFTSGPRGDSLMLQWKHV